jgi:hypothetical protein
MPAAIIERRPVTRLKIVDQLIVHAERHPDFRGKNLHRAGESFRHDPDNGERPGVDRDGRAEQGGIESLLLPVIVAHHRDGRVAPRFLLVRQKAASLKRLNTEDGEIIRRDDIGESASGISFVANPDHGEVVRHHTREDGVLLADVDVGRIGETAEAGRLLFVLGEELHDLVRLRENWRLEK